MSNKSLSRHLKRLNLPPYIKILRKKYKYIAKPNPGPHPIKDSITLAILLRDYLKIAMNMREVKYLVKNRKIKVDNRVITDPRFPIGFQDIIEIEEVGKFRVDIDDKGYFVLREHEDNNKVLKVINKVKIKGGKLQYTFHDGRTLISDDNSILIGDSVVFDLENKKILKIISQKDSKNCIVLRGKHRGFRGRIREVLDIGKKVADIVNDNGQVVRTDYKYLFLLGG